MRVTPIGFRQRLKRMYAVLRHWIFFRERQRYHQTLRAASLGMTRIRNLPKLLELICRIIVSNVRVGHATVFLKDAESPQFTAVASRGKLKKPLGMLHLGETSPLVSLLTQRRQPIVYDELKGQLSRSQQRKYPKEDRTLKYVVREMEQLQAAVCVPSFIHKKLQGFLMLGEKLSGDIYDQEDLGIFSTLTSQAALAIENAQAYEELRNTRGQLLYSERMRTIGEFAANMAHEIKNPLQAILTFFQLLPRKYDDPDFRERFSKLAQSEAERISDLVRQLMTYAKPRPPDFKPIEVSQPVDSVLAFLENDLDKYGIEVRKGYSTNGLMLEADRDQMKQVFLNLFTNAIEAMSENASKPNLLDIVAFPDGKHLVVKVRDTGPGIPESHLPMIFAPFFTTKEKGSGLGLAVVQSILQAHNASIRVESQVGAGSTFIITFPHRQSDGPVEKPPEPAMVSGRFRKPVKRRGSEALSMLLVDPVKDALESTKLFFEQKGVICWTAADGPGALRILVKRQPDLVLSEIVLKNVASVGLTYDGFAILREAKRLSPERPVFLITACDFPEFRQKAQELGADGYLVKPTPLDELLGILPGP